jgi:drug/metabolite transporter (DMT)-like permease
MIELLRTPRSGMQVGCPLLLLAFATVVLRERASVWTWLGAVVGIVGVQLILQPDEGASGSTTLLALVMGLAFSLYVVLTRALRTEPRAANLVFTAICVLAPLSLVMLMVWRMPPVQDMVIMTTIGLVGLALLWALDRACESVSAKSQHG